MSGVADAEQIDPQLLAKLLPYLTESIMVVRVDGTIAANLAPPGGLFGHGDRVGSSHPLQFAHPDDLPMALELSVNALQTEPGWRGAGLMRARVASGEYQQFELTVENRTDDPVINGFVARTRSIEGFDTSIYNVPTHGELLESLAEAIPVPLVVMDPFGMPVWVNQPAVELLGTDLATMQREGVPGLEDTVAARQVEAGVTTTEISLGDKTLAVRVISRGGIPGRVASIVATFEDITELSRRADLDSLTNLPNRASVLNELTARLAADATKVSVIYCDLDGFKLVNDRYGHAVGDGVLTHVAGVLRDVVREGDIVGRVGGDEFVFVCNDLSDADVTSILDRITTELETAVPPDAPRVSASLGVARGRDGDAPRDVLHRADVAMYAAKRASRHA